MVTMKIVVRRNENRRKVINTISEPQLIVLDNRSQRRSYYNIEKSTSRHIPGTNHYERTETDARYLLQVKRDLAKSREQLAKLSLNVSEDEKIESDVEPARIELREPVLQFSRSYENPAASSSSNNTASSQITGDSITECFQCNVCTEFALPEVYECQLGHTVCENCWLISSHCSVCFNQNHRHDKKTSTFRRVYGMERIAALLTFPCRWRKRGCLESLSAATWRNHVDSCRHTELTAKSTDCTIVRALQLNDSAVLDNELDISDHFVEFL